ncbi:hypothetical protein CR513_11223, partial [Mucuna pruriens]
AKKEGSGRGNCNDENRSSHSFREERHERHERHRREERRERCDRREEVITSFDTQGQKGVRLVTLAFVDYALFWWTSMMDDIKRGIIKPCKSWYDLKRLMRKRFVPSSYNLYQGSKSVKEYQKEMEMNLLRSQIRERKETTMARFLYGLNREI